MAGNQSAASVNTTETSQDWDTDVTDGSPNWLAIGVVIFIVVLVLSLATSVSVSVYRSRQYGKRRGLYKSKSTVEAILDEKHETHYDMFTVIKH